MRFSISDDEYVLALDRIVFLQPSDVAYYRKIRTRTLASTQIGDSLSQPSDTLHHDRPRGLNNSQLGCDMPPFISNGSF